MKLGGCGVYSPISKWDFVSLHTLQSLGHKILSLNTPIRNLTGRLAACVGPLGGREMTELVHNWLFHKTI
jgi:hypothetical protein